ncbi:MAG: ABC transporter permease [Spirochaetota bacterium]
MKFGRNTSRTIQAEKLSARPEFASLLMLAVMVLLTAILQNNFFTFSSLSRSANAFAPLILLTMGQAVVIISGGLDLSVGSSLSLMTCILTYVMKTGEPITGFYALIITFAAALLIGLINGIGVGYFRIPSVIATFATSYIWLGIALFIRPTPGGESVEWFKMFYNLKYLEGAPQFLVAVTSVIPPAVILIIIGGVFWSIIRRTRLGRYIYAVGGSSDSSFHSGINPAMVQIKAYMINAVFIFLAALFFVGQNQSGDARFGDPFTLRVVAAAVVGGVALSGGRGSILFAVVGALIMSFVNRIIFFLGIPNAFQTLVGGVIIILAISSSQVYAVMGKKNIKGKGGLK